MIQLPRMITSRYNNHYNILFHSFNAICDKYCSSCSCNSTRLFILPFSHTSIFTLSDQNTDLKPKIERCAANFDPISAPIIAKPGFSKLTPSLIYYSNHLNLQDE